MKPILYEVDRARDGRSFSNRRVVAVQHGRPIFNMTASFQKPETGIEHQPRVPDVPPPEELAELPDDADLHRSLLAYVSDYQLVGTTILPHGIRWEQDNVQMASRPSAPCSEIPATGCQAARLLSDITRLG